MKVSDIIGNREKEEEEERREKIRKKVEKRKCRKTRVVICNKLMSFVNGTCGLNSVFYSASFLLSVINYPLRYFLLLAGCYRLCLRAFDRLYSGVAIVNQR